MGTGDGFNPADAIDMENKLFKRFIWVVIGVLLWSSTALAAPPSQVLGTRHKLPNDLVWLFSSQTELPLVTLDLLIKAGTLEDPPGKEGLANLTASLLLNGTQSRTSAKIAEELDFMGARLSVEGGVLVTIDAIPGRRRRRRAIALLLLGLRQCLEQNLVQERGFSRARHSRDGDQHAERNADVQSFQIVCPCAANPDLLRARLPPSQRRLNAQIFGEIATRQRGRIAPDFLIGARGDHLPAVLPGARSKIENAVGGTHDVGIVLNHQDRVSQVAQIMQDIDEPVSVARVQSDGRFVEDIERADQPRAQRSRQLNTLRLTAGKSGRKAVQCEIFQPYIIEKPEPLAKFLQQLVCNVGFLRTQFELVEEARRILDRHRANLADVAAADLYLPRLQTQAAAVTRRAQGISPVSAQEDAHVKLVFLPLEMTEKTAYAKKSTFAVQYKLLVLRVEFLPRYIERNPGLLRITLQVGEQRPVLSRSGFRHSNQI